jgi:hypothetical protein
MTQLISGLMLQRKFALAMLFSITIIVALFTGFLTGGEFIMGMGTLLGLYAAANVAQRQVEK